ncbi:MAG: OmpA family protein [Bradymonadia bacterium]
MIRSHRALPFTTLSLATLLFVGAGCGGPPTKTLAEAEGALADARLAEKCAPEEYAAAQRMMDKANEQLAEEDYDKAEQSARAARKLAEKAQQKALARKEECERELNEANQPTASVDEVIDPNAGTNTVEISDNAGELQTIFFDYNAFDLTPEARRTLAENAAWMNKQAESRVVVEGHCDKRGSSEYNLALGERRSKVVMKYLRSLGVPNERMIMLSYGEESLIDYGETESAHARNRRVEFRKQ